MQKEHEEIINMDYMKKWIQVSEEDAKKRKHQEEQKLQKKQELQEYLKLQMGEVNKESSGIGAPSIAS